MKYKQILIMLLAIASTKAFAAANWAQIGDDGNPNTIGNAAYSTNSSSGQIRSESNVSIVTYVKQSGVSGTLRNIDSSINHAVDQAEKLYEKNHGGMITEQNILIANAYLQTLRITKDYIVEIQLSSNTGTPVSQGLQGAKIKLIPIYRYQDKKIMSWECITNADSSLQKFKGENNTKINTRSDIIHDTTNHYLSSCIYNPNHS